MFSRACQDHRCGAHPHHSRDKVLCEDCEVPICKECRQDLSAGRLPPLSLANDMWTGYAPHRLAEQKVTVMEAICASPCITMLTCMTMEARYVIQEQEAKTAAPLNSVAHMARHRFGARGNALTFPLPLEDLFSALQEHAAAANAGEPLKLPRMGGELGCVARVLLKTNKKGATTEEEMKSLIHQAVVRREVRSCGQINLKEGVLQIHDLLNQISKVEIISFWLASIFFILWPAFDSSYKKQ